MKTFQLLYKPAFIVMLAVLISTLCSPEVFASPVKTDISVGVFTDRCPMFFVDPQTDEIIGIGVDLMRFSAENAGLNVTFKQIEEENLKEALDNETYDLVMPFGSAISSANGDKTIISDSLLQMPFTIVTLRSYSKNDKRINISNLRIGMLRSLAGASETVKQLYPDIQISFYDELSDSVKALRSGDVDALLHNSYMWSYVLQKPSYGDLVVHPAAMFSMDFCVGALDTPENRILIDKLNNGIEALSDTRRQAVILDYTARRLYHNDLGDFLFIYWISILLVMLLVVSIIMIAVQRKKALRRQHEEDLRKIINEDSLTCALSLQGFRKRAAELLKDHSDVPYLILYTNISDFKYINDSVGMDAGDDLLRFLASKTAEILRVEEAICRLEGDHFVILRRIYKEEVILKEYKDVINAVRNYFADKKGNEEYIQIRSGIYVLTPEDYENINIDHMIDLARIAEKRVRKSGKKEGYEIYNPDQWIKGKRNSEIISHLPAAIKSGELQVWYQPQVNYDTGEINGAEALCRWNHSKLGWISPGEFIPALEEAGLIRDLDAYIWECVCKDLKRWNKQGMKRTVSVNLSRNDIGEDINVTEYFSNLIRRYGLKPEQLRIEITETVFSENPDILINTTSELKAAGFIVEMDDFGSGYSSLNILKEVPVDVIKLDLLFLRKSEYPEKSRIIIRNIIKMVQELDLDMVAEGVETKENAEFLKSQGCFEMQGYYFYKPMPVKDFEAVLKPVNN